MNQAVTEIVGTFAIKLTPQEDPKCSAGRMILEKQWQTGITGASYGQMLSARTPIENSAGYVAIEHMDVTIGDRSGTFVLQHIGTMDRGNDYLAINVVPDSGTGEFENLRGEMQIVVLESGHEFQFRYWFVE